MAKYIPKRLESQYNWRTSIQHHVKLKRPNNLQQQSSHKTEATKVNAIMEKLEESDGNLYRKRNNINDYLPHYESENEEGTQHSTKLNTPIILPSVNEKGSKNKGGQNNINEEDGNDR